MFKIGDKVRRIKGIFHEMEKGDIDIIIKINKHDSGNCVLDLKEFRPGHASYNFELARERNEI